MTDTEKLQAFNIDNDYNNNYYEHSCIQGPLQNTLIVVYINVDKYF